MSVSNWIPPLPPGFEARWDPNQRAYFFIDHKNKATTWVDPRAEYYAKQPKDHPPPNAKPSSHGEPVFGFRGSGATPKKESTFVGLDEAKFNMLKSMFPDVGDETLRVTLKIKSNNIQEARAHLTKAGYTPRGEVDHSSHAQLQMENTVKKLQKVYPMARFDVIRDIVAGCNGNEASAKSQLEVMGYKSVGSSQETRPKSESRSRSPSPTPTKPKISEAEKRRVINRVKGNHSDLSEDFIKMALETVNFDEELFERMHKSLENTSGPSTSGTSGASSSSARSRVFDDEVTFKPTGSLVPETFSGGNEPVVFGHDIDQSSAGQSVSFEIPFTTDSQQTPSKQKTTHSPTKKPQSNKASDTVAKMTQKVQKQTDRHETIDQHAARLKAEERQRQQQTDRREAIEQHAARMKAQERQRQELERQKQQQNRLKPKQVSPVDPSHIVLDQPRSSLAKGPDPTIRRGADKSLLLTDYVPVSGPNPEYSQGPDRSRVQGPQGAMGADRTLACGPQADHRNMMDRVYTMTSPVTAL